MKKVLFIILPCYDRHMGKNSSKNFVNQFKNTRRMARLEQRKIVKGAARRLKKFLPGEGKKEKNSDRGDH